MSKGEHVMTPKRERIEWCDLWIKDADKNNVPRVLLVGDSITRSYHPFVETSLGETSAVARLATSACVCDPDFPRQLQPVVEGYEFEVIHFNNGLHGWDYSEEQYAEGYQAVAAWIADHAPKARIILALTTPVWVKNQRGRLDEKTQRVRQRNQAVRNIASQKSLAVNDLFDLTIDHSEYFSDDGVHFKDEGKEILGAHVAEAIRNVM
jgi:hypothetical protein